MSDANIQTIETIKENRKKWVEALRSGKWKQSKHKLFNQEDKGFCCLGVACAVLEGVTPDAPDFFEKAYEVVEKKLRSTTGQYIEPRRAMELLGISYKMQRELATMNDGTTIDRSFNFSEIADMIEPQPILTDFSEDVETPLVRPIEAPKQGETKP